MKRIVLTFLCLALAAGLTPAGRSTAQLPAAPRQDLAPVDWQAQAPAAPRQDLTPDAWQAQAPAAPRQDLAPDAWQAQAVGLSAANSTGRRTAGLGFMVQAEGWPVLSAFGGVTDAGYGMLVASQGLPLGAVQIPGAGAAALVQEDLDWTHNEMHFEAGGAQLKLWASRLTPAVLVHTQANTLDLLAGDITRHALNGGSLSRLADGPVSPRYAAFVSQGAVKSLSLSAGAQAIQPDENWLLVWYGRNSAFADTRRPVTYSGPEWALATLPQSEAYQADLPVLLVFQNRPQSIRQGSTGGVELGFAGGSGYVSIVPLYGRSHRIAVETEAWGSQLPPEVLEKARWWAGHACAFPLTAREEYAYSPASDTTTVQETLQYLTVCAGGETFAPLPPMLGLVKDRLEVSISGPVSGPGLNTEFGPFLGLEGRDRYTWSLSGLGKYADAVQAPVDSRRAPAPLVDELKAQVGPMVSAGHLMPWIFADHIPTNDFLGDIYWNNPADTVSALAALAEVLPEPERAQVIDYMRSERSQYPPESLLNVPLDQGAERGGFSTSGAGLVSRWKAEHPEAFYTRTPLYNLYALASYYRLTGEALPAGTWRCAQEILSDQMREQDWATFYPFQGYEDRAKVAVWNANRQFAGLVGFIRLAQASGDHASETVGRGLLAKAAVLRLGLAHFPRYLYQANVLALPANPEWQVRYTMGKWVGYLFNYDWDTPDEDVRQMGEFNQFGVHLEDYSGTARGTHLERVNAYLTAFRDLVPELGRFLGDQAGAESRAYLAKVTALVPHWYAAFSEGVLGMEHNVNHPVDSFQIFMAKAWIEDLPAGEQARLADIAWLERGDLFYLQKLAQAIRAYSGGGWNDEILVQARGRDRSITLSWRFAGSPPAGAAWQVHYEGPPGDQPAPINDLPLATRELTLTGLQNYARYTLWVSLVQGQEVLLQSEPVSAMPTDRILTLPMVPLQR